MDRDSPPRPHRLTVRRLLAVLAAAACGWAAYAFYGQVSQDRALAGRLTQLQQANSALEEQIAERSLEIAEAQGPAWVEEQARKLGYHLPGESIYVVAPSGQMVPRSGGLNATPPTFDATTPTASPSPSPSAAKPGSPTPTPTPTPTIVKPPPVSPAPSPAGR
ncbi:MAG TPA: septum formation initiator family protein [Candidatus Binatia bacterium]|nr:septum formation initiator family protein [Candidatus Binatia bacterium]